jgi:prolyl oligopeptidase
MPKTSAALLLAVSLAALGACGPKERLPAPPATRAQPTVTSYHGVQVTASYRWLDDAASPEVRRWIEEQNTYTDTVLARFPEGRVLADRVRELLTTSPEQSSPVLVDGTLFYERATPPQQQPVLVAQRWPSGTARVLVDLNPAGGRVAITGFWPSPRGRYVVFGTAQDGKPVTTFHVLDVASGRTLPDTMPYAGGGPSGSGVAWDPDERGFTYTRYPVPETWFDLTLYHHTLGRPYQRDPAVFGPGYSPIVEYRLLASPGARQAALLANVGDGSPAEVWFRGVSGWRRAADTSLGVREAKFVGERLFAIATAGTPRGRLLTIAPDGTTTEVLPEGERAMHAVAPVGGGFLLTTHWGPDWRLEHRASDGALVRRVDLPEGITVSTIASSPDAAEALISYSGWTVPRRWARYDGRTGALRTVFEVQTAGDYAKVVAHRLDAVSKDGTHVPVTVLALEGTPQDGSAPAILTSYGGFGIPVAPGFIGPLLAWLERGGVLAYANIRGGDEFGEAWHQEGMLTRKQNGFDDFYAAAQELVRQRWTRSSRLGIKGGSNGALLVGAALTQHPEQYRAAAAFVGVYDMMRHAEIPNGRYNIPEYGTAEDSASFAAQYAYSPLFHVRKGTAYPAVLLETGVNDPLVAPWQSWEFTAALQAASSSVHPVLLLTRFDAGHGSASFSQQVGNTAVMLAFFAHELGLAVGR